MAAIAWLIWDNWDSIKEYWEKITNVIGEWWGTCKQKTDEIIGVTKETWNSFVGSCGAMWGKISASCSEAWQGVKEFLNSTFDGSGDKIENFFSSIATKISELYEKAKTLGSGIVQPIIDAWTRLKEFFSGLFSSLTEGFGKIMEPLKTVWGKIKGYLPGNAVESAKQAASPVAELKTVAQEGNKTQNNKFEVTINAKEEEEGKSLAAQFMDKVSSGFSSLFLFDKGATAL